MFNSHIMFVVLIGAGSTLAASYHAASSTNCTINWFSCQQNATLPVTCGTITVPLDYTEPCSNKSLNVQLLKFNATKQPVMGSILFNPGGPGDSSREFLASYAQEMMIATSEHYNLIAFETRGVGDTLPFSCFDNPTDEAVFASSAPVSTNASDISLGLTWSVGTLLAETCYEKNKDIGEYMSTAFIARDMIQIVDALNEDGLLRYYGFSYGTVLGATVAAMFPERIDKMVLDGVVNAAEWIYGSNEQEVLQSDDAVRQYFQNCLDEPDTCAIQRRNATANQLFDEVVELLEDLKYNPIVLGVNVSTSIVQGPSVKNLIYVMVKTGMSTGIGLSVYINAIIERNATVYQEALAALTASSPPIYPNNGPDAIYGTQCPDIQPRTDDLESLTPIIKHNYAESYFGGALPIGLLFPCVQWKMKSKETFTGPFVGKTKNPILFVSSPYDPATPMASARNMSQGFEGSIILQQNGVGHCSLAQPSVCVIKATSAYFLNGTLPPENTICEPTFNFVSNHTILEIYELAAVD